MSRFRNLPSSFGYAFSGFITALKKEPNFQIHVVIGTVAILLGVFFRLPPLEWLILLFTISFVLILEFWNTAIEAIVDLISPDIHPKAKIAKDVSAAAVLLGAFVAILVGIVIFLPRILG